MTQSSSFPERLKHEREIRGWSQGDLASKLKCSSKAVGRWERGEGTPQPYYRQRIYELFNKNAEEMGLLEGLQTSSSTASTEASPSSNIQEMVLLPQRVEDEVASSLSIDLVRENTVPSQETGNGAPPSSSMPPMQEAGSPPGDMGDRTQASSQTSSTRDTGREPFSSPEGATIEEVRLPPWREPLITYDIHPKWVVALAWEPCGKRIASAGAGGSVHIWHSDTRQTLQIYRGHESQGILARTPFVPTVYTVVWSPDGRRIASAGDGKEVHIWNPDTGATILKYTGHSGIAPNVYAIAWSPDGRRMASACSSSGLDKTVHIWDTRTGKTLLRYKTPSGLLPNFSVLALDWSPDGSRIASTCSNGKAYIWNTLTEEIVTYTTPSDWVCDVAWSPNSRWLAVGNGDRTIQIWDASIGQVVLTYSGHTDSIRNIAWSPDGAYIASASNDTTVRVWSPITGDAFSTYRGHSHWATAVVWSPDGTRIASASNDKTVQIWQPFASPVETYV